MITDFLFSSAHSQLSIWLYIALIYKTTQAWDVNTYMHTLCLKRLFLQKVDAHQDSTIFGATQQSFLAQAAAVDLIQQIFFVTK